jgi:integrating conjugative element protein (TIGR03746 family)
MAYRSEIANQQREIKILYGVIAGLVIIVAGLYAGWFTAPGRIDLNYPPDLRNGATQKLGDMPPANVYAFAHYIFQQINYWPENGSQDYGKAVYRFAAYLTPKYRQQLLDDLKERGKAGELQRTRTVSEVPGHGYEEKRVDILGNGSWVVWLDLQMDETVNGIPVKRAALRYPIHVVRYDVSRETNPYGLALDGYTSEGPRRLTEEELKGVAKQ